MAHFTCMLPFQWFLSKRSHLNFISHMYSYLFFFLSCFFFFFFLIVELLLHWLYYYWWKPQNCSSLKNVCTCGIRWLWHFVCTVIFTFISDEISVTVVQVARHWHTSLFFHYIFSIGSLMLLEGKANRHHSTVVWEPMEIRVLLSCLAPYAVKITLKRIISIKSSSQFFTATFTLLWQNEKNRNLTAVQD